MGERAEHELCVVQWCVLGTDERNVFPGDARHRPTLFVCRSKRERKIRVTKNECAELAASVAAGAQHTDRYFIHKECIIMQSLDVNALELIARLGERFVDTSVEDRCEPKK